ncbi:hypothetical protein FVEG_16191 [Fusarium verticillioides 7600]|uniref:Secreted protein n=1 Tax=Gibberella moniliformis (strain M3125 / FGSC 7600) TaxID=334819 RepID=W7MJL7_GIBM7|nr:hypothetical protein FVEG_16191 [Fusarium verticillioides 7600]EWG47830.1 hypothetical protein FVEG_16191 [Fusarium verticillioides 7600]
MSGRNRRVYLVTRLSVMSLFCFLENPIKCLYLPIDLVEDVEYYITVMMYVQYLSTDEYVLSSKNRYICLTRPFLARPTIFHYLVAPRPYSPSVVYLAFTVLFPFPSQVQGDDRWLSNAAFHTTSVFHWSCPTYTVSNHLA